MIYRRSALPAVLVVAVVCALGFAPGAFAAGPASGFVPVRVLIGGGSSPIVVTGASVTLRPGGRTVAAGRTYSSGLALVSGSGIPARSELRTSGGWIGKARFLGHLVVSVARYRTGSTIVIDPVTTLSARLCADLRSNDLPRCDARVRAFLKLPRGTNLSAGLASEPQFDAQRFLRVARRHGGIAPFLLDLGRRLQSQPHSTYDLRRHESTNNVHVRVPSSPYSAKGGLGSEPAASTDWVANLTGADQQPNPNVLQNWDNWTSDQTYCVRSAGGGFGCKSHRTYPQILAFLRLPVLFDRTPGDTAAECYYWPASNEPTTGNGCLVPLPSP